MIFTTTPSPTGPAAFVQLLDVMLGSIGAYINRHLPHPLDVLFCNRVRRLGQRFVAMAEKARAGTLKPPRPRSATPRKPSVSARPLDLLPRQRGWVLRMGVHSAAVHHIRFQNLLTQDAEIMALIAAEPQRCGRILRPLIWMLGITDVPEVLRLPPRVRKVPAEPRALRPARREPPPDPPPPPPPQPQYATAQGSFDPVIAIRNALTPFRT